MSTIRFLDDARHEAEIDVLIAAGWRRLASGSELAWVDPRNPHVRLLHSAALRTQRVRDAEARFEMDKGAA